MDRSQKETFVVELQERVSSASVMYLTDFTGLDVKAMTELRRTLKGSGAEYVVVKNRLVQRVFEAAEGLPDISSSLEGPTGLVFGYEDAVSTAKIVSDFAKEHENRPVFKIGVMDNQVLEPAQITKLASLPPREHLLAQLAGALEGPMAALASALGAKLQEMAGLIDALRVEREKSS